MRWRTRWLIALLVLLPLVAAHAQTDSIGTSTFLHLRHRWPLPTATVADSQRLRWGCNSGCVDAGNFPVNRLWRTVEWWAGPIADLTHVSLWACLDAWRAGKSLGSWCTPYERPKPAAPPPPPPPPPPPLDTVPASITVLPSTLAGVAGTTAPVRAVVRNKAGDSLAAQPLGWNTSSSAVAFRSSADRLVHLVAPGTATLQAWIRGLGSNVLTVTVSAAPPPVPTDTVSRMISVPATLTVEAGKRATRLCKFAKLKHSGKWFPVDPRVDTTAACRAVWASWAPPDGAGKVDLVSWTGTLP